MIDRLMSRLHSVASWLLRLTCHHYWMLEDERTVRGVGVVSRHWCKFCFSDATITVPEGQDGWVTVEQGRRGPIRWRVSTPKWREEGTK